MPFLFCALFPLPLLLGHSSLRLGFSSYSELWFSPALNTEFSFPISGSILSAFTGNLRKSTCLHLKNGRNGIFLLENLLLFWWLNSYMPETLIEMEGIKKVYILAKWYHCV
jgi:hypothetical protein